MSPCSARITATSKSSYGCGSSSTGSAATAALARSSVVPSISRSMRILNSLSVGSWRTDSAPASAASASQRALEAELRVRLGRDREPQVELVVAQVVVRDAGVRVDDSRRAVRVLGVDLGGDEHRAVAERARVEDRRDLADDALVQQVLDARHRLVLGDPGQLGDARVGRGSIGNFPCIRLSRRLSSSSSGIAAPCLRLRSFGVAVTRVGQSALTAIWRRPSRGR